MIEKIKSYDIFKNHPPLSCEPLAQQGHANTIYLIKTSQDILQNSLESEASAPNKTRLKPSFPSFEKTSQKKYLLREFKISIDRKTEFSIQKKAYQHNIGAKPILLDREKGLMISEFIEGKHKEKLNQHELKKMALLLKKLHKIKIRQKRNSFKENFNFKNKKVKRAFMILEKEAKEYTLGHNDLHSQNILFTKRAIKLIDWEYARYSDIYFDLVSIIIEYKLNRKDKTTFLRSYFQKKRVNPKKIEAFTLIYKELWKLWFEKLERGEL